LPKNKVVSFTNNESVNKDQASINFNCRPGLKPFCVLDLETIVDPQKLDNSQTPFIITCASGIVGQSLIVDQVKLFMREGIDEISLRKL
jgi:hypothetical protein